MFKLQSVETCFLQLTPDTKRAILRAYCPKALVRAYQAVKRKAFLCIGQLENMQFLLQRWGAGRITGCLLIVQSQSRGKYELLIKSVFTVFSRKVGTISYFIMDLCYPNVLMNVDFKPLQLTYVWPFKYSNYYRGYITGHFVGEFWQPSVKAISANIRREDRHAVVTNT